MELEQLTAEELEKQYREEVSNVRYYLNTDDINNWNREEKERAASKQRYNALLEEYKRRDLTPPRIP